MSASTPSDRPRSWAEQMKALEPVGERLMARWGRANPTERDRLDMDRLALSAVAGGYLGHVHMDPRRPTWAPLWNIAMNMGGPCPDYVYLTTDIDPKGVYRVSGFRGTLLFVEITQRGWELLGGAKTNSPNPATIELDSLKIGPDGYFSLIASAERPAGYDGDWWRLQESAVRLLMRKASYDWLRETDARLAIERLDEGPPTSQAEIVRRLNNMAAWVEGMIGFDIDLARYYREHHGVNVLTRSQKIKQLGGLPDQAYYDGAYEIGDDEALVVETALPAKVLYWSMLVADDRFSTVDWVNRQSSINGFQARLDADGKFRAVIAAKDPGVPNWLDKADNPWGIIQLRWHRASDAPDPEVRRVAFADIRKHLPADTPVVTPAERAAQLRQRREAAQMRSLW
jgi:hypothetical protein